MCFLGHVVPSLKKHLPPPPPPPSSQSATDPNPQQATMHRFLSYRQRFAKFQSARLQRAVAGIAGGHNDDIMLGEKEKKGGRKRKTQREGDSPAGKKKWHGGRGGGRGQGKKGDE